MAIWITLAGLVVAAIVIVLFMPTYSYWAAAYGHLASYVVMFAISAILGAKYYPIPYRWGRLGAIVGLMFLIYGGSMLLDAKCFANVVIGEASYGAVAAKLGVHTVLILVYLAGAWKTIRR
jgi:hypothetical protein